MKTKHKGFMRKGLMLLLFAIACGVVSATEKMLPDTIVQKELNDDGEWSSTLKEIYTYQPDGKVQTKITMKWNAFYNDWLFEKKYVHTYSDNGLVYEAKTYGWNKIDNDWRLKQVWKTEKDEKGNSLLEYSESVGTRKDSMVNEYVDGKKTAYLRFTEYDNILTLQDKETWEYDESGDLVAYTIYANKYKDETVENVPVKRITYSKDGTEGKILLEELYEGGDRDSIMQTFDESDNLIEQIGFIDDKYSYLAPYSSKTKEIYSYSDGGALLNKDIYKEKRENGEWEKVATLSLDYYESGALKDSTASNLNVDNNVFEEIYSFQFTEEGKLESELFVGYIFSHYLSNSPLSQQIGAFAETWCDSKDFFTGTKDSVIYGYFTDGIPQYYKDVPVEVTEIASSIERYTWDEEKGAFVPKSLVYRTEEDNEFVETSYLWNETEQDWVASTKIEVLITDETYSDKSYTWNTELEDWEVSQILTQTNDEYGNLVEHKVERFDSQTGEMEVTLHRMLENHYPFEEETDIDVTINEEFLIYPTLVDKQLTIKSDVCGGSAMIVGVDGAVYTTVVLHNAVTVIDVFPMPQGVYYVKTDAGKLLGSFVKK